MSRLRLTEADLAAHPALAAKVRHALRDPAQAHAGPGEDPSAAAPAAAGDNPQAWKRLA